MKTLAKPEKFRILSPYLYGYEAEDETNDDGTPLGSAWVSKTYRNHNVTISRHKCVATNRQPMRCRVGATFVTFSW